MSASVAKRLKKEIASLQTAPEGITGGPVDDNMLLWKILLRGPADSPYAKGEFPLEINIPADFPFKPPVIKFLVKVYHPNVNDDGSICLGIIKSEAWKPSTQILEILQEIVLLLKNPNPDDPLVASIAEQFVKDRKKFETIAEEWTKKHASK